MSITNRQHSLRYPPITETDRRDTADIPAPGTLIGRHRRRDRRRDRRR